MRSGTPMDALENGGETQARMLEAVSSVGHHESEEKAKGLLQRDRGPSLDLDEFAV